MRRRSGVPAFKRSGVWIACGVLAAAWCALAATAGSAQDTGGVAAPPTGSVYKHRAPVAKDLLKVRFPRPKSFTLSNGLAVYVLEDPKLPAVRLSLSVRTGTVFESKPAVADLTAGMLTEGTRTRDYRQLAVDTEGIGASLTAAAGIENATLSASGLSESTDTLLDIIADVLLHPAFPKDRLERLKFQQTSQAAQRRASPQSITADLSAKTFYGGTPFGKPAPEPAEIDAVTTEDLAAFHTDFYRPNGAIMGVSGDVEPAVLRSRLESLLGGWKPGARSAETPSPELKPKEVTRIYLVDRPGSAQTVLQFGNLAVRRDDADYVPLVVANRILGGGSSGRLFQNIRERQGFTYGAYSSLTGARWPGVWGASASVRTPVTEPAVREFFSEFNRLQNELVPADELERAKRSIIGSFALTLESPQGILSRTLELVQDALPLDYWDTYPSRIQAVSAADVQRVARKYLGKNRIQLFAVGERSQIEEGLRKFGPVEIVKP